MWIIEMAAWTEKDDINRHASMEEGHLMGPQPHTENSRQLRHAESGRHSLPPAEEPDWLSNTRYSGLTSYT